MFLCTNKIYFNASILYFNSHFFEVDHINLISDVYCLLFHITQGSTKWGGFFLLKNK
jgi:hypothetical protein